VRMLTFKFDALGLLFLVYSVFECI
jgi:hypothetical protein